MKLLDKRDPLTGKPAWHVWISVSVICIIVVTLFSFVNEKAHAYQVCESGKASVTQVDAKKTACTNDTPEKHVKRFKKGKTGNSEGIKITKHVRKMLNKAAKKDKVAAKGIIDKWWNYPVSRVTCAFWKQNIRTCLETKKKLALQSFKEDMDHSTKVILNCSGAGFISVFVYRTWDWKTLKWIVTRKGWYGIGPGTAVCVALDVYNKWFPKP